ncbi:unnamed protein product [Danaus chrysippus]|uniref:NADH-ubiquinone oxidoreductase 75 kDa subunit, mitochondrial n=1 Tax=Danaus chrysippus TaxID=151541 RepID=A0A8J2R8G8_9NEOP|nr:unnamed protein product [Danaus chrysippus]
MIRTIKNLLKNLNIAKNQVRHSSGETNLFINGKPITVPSYFTILQALRHENVTIPTFCYHDRLSIAGNCRMCLVEIEGMWKPQIACAMPVAKNMKVRTNSEVAYKAQEGVLEFLLTDHPLDCPICDQGGECDLQDLSMKFGNDRTRFTDIHFEGKRAVENKNLGPLIRTEMTRCIHCTRCIRFASQVCGLDVLGTAGRGGEMLVGTYVDKMFLSELSGNIIDLCPVGALTNKPYMFKARPWEINRANSIDVTDATGTNISVNYRFDRVLRVLPRENEEVNQEWLSDKGRWSIDSLDIQRLVTPMYKCNDCLIPTEWDKVLKMVSKLLKCNKAFDIMAIAGPYCNAETLVATKDLLNVLGSEHTYVERNLDYSETVVDIRASYSLNICMKNVALSDKILLVGTNPRFEAPILNARIRQAYMFNECDIYVIGPKCEYNYHVEYVGESVKDLANAKNYLEKAKSPLIFVGIDQLDNPDAVTLMRELIKISNSLKKSSDWKVLNILTKEASFAGALEAGWKPGGIKAIQSLKPRVILSLGADEVFRKWTPPKECSVIYIGFQGDSGAKWASIILPGSAYTEAGGTFLNMECRSQFAQPAVSPPGKARFDWKIIRAIAEYCKICLFYTDEDSICRRLAQISPNFVSCGTCQKRLFEDLIPQLLASDSSDCGGQPFDVCMKKLKEYYCSDIYTSNSPTMVKAQKAVMKMEKSPYCPV